MQMLYLINKWLKEKSKLNIAMYWYQFEETYEVEYFHFEADS